MPNRKMVTPATISLKSGLTRNPQARTRKMLGRRVRCDTLGRQGSIMPRMVKNSMAAMRAETGTVISHAATMRISAERLTSSWR